MFNVRTRARLAQQQPWKSERWDHWQGLMPWAQMTPAQAAETRFAVFAAPKWGFRALAIVLMNYGRLYGLKTVRQIITRWAPTSENDTAAYIAAVSKAVGIGPDTPLDFTDPDPLAALAKAIAIHECGGWFFKDADLKGGIALSGPSSSGQV